MVCKSQRLCTKHYKRVLRHGDTLPRPRLEIPDNIYLSGDLEIAWAAGLYEGEGHVSWSRTRPSGGRWVLSVGMTDEDIVRGWADVTGARVSGPRATTHKPIWVAGIYRHAHVVVVMEAFLPWLGERRTEQWETSLARWSERFDVASGE